MHYCMHFCLAKNDIMSLRSSPLSQLSYWYCAGPGVGAFDQLLIVPDIVIQGNEGRVMEGRSLNRCVLFVAIIIILTTLLGGVPVDAAVMVSHGCRVYQGGDLGGMPLNYASNTACRDLCLSRADCNYVTWIAPGTSRNPNAVGVCWLKGSSGSGLVDLPSGDCNKNPPCESWEKQEESAPGGGSYGPPPGGGSCSGVAPNADFTATPVSGEKPLSVRFTAVVASGASEGWTFGDSSGVSNEHNPTHVYAKAGTFTVDHMVSIPDSCGVDHIDRKTKTNYITVTEPVQPGKLYVSSTPSGASVYVDTVYQGTTTVTIPQLTPGYHTVRLTLTGYEEHSESVTITAGQTYPLSVQLTQSQSPSITVTGSSGTTGSGQSSGTGTLQISSNPSGAAIILDGNNKGTTPATFSDISAGTHKINFTKSGYWDFSQDITVAAGKTTPVNVNLVLKSQPAPSPAGSVTASSQSQQGAGGSIVISSNPPGANVYLDGKTSGTTPVTLQNVDPGTHTVLLTMSGYTDASRTVEVAAGSQNQIAVDLTGGKKMPGFGAALALLSIAGLAAFMMLRRKEE
jgi:PKD repeat protein